jgi:hypothetical protein
VERGGLDIVVPQLPEVSVDDEVSMHGALAHVRWALFARKFCDFLPRLEADDPGPGKTIGCLLEEWGIRNKRKNVGSIILKDKSFKSKSNNNGFLSRRKTYVDA